ncbi:hypothetical protein M758_7G158700 [Ceratodon purpureus]|nr:hypothetical protein M758_7G158700 [Ceratodon purpureus]
MSFVACSAVARRGGSNNGRDNSSSNKGSSGLGFGRLVRSSSSASCSLGFGDYGACSSASENTRTLFAPFYRPASNPAFVKPARSWVDPLRFLLKKELTVTDVGELGRIILPKRDAECQLPHLDSKEGRLLNMEDYNSNKNWTLRYKWWPNNKSRMYVLESTGEFVKYYDLKEKDELILYRDGAGTLVIRGQKWSPANSLLRTDSFPFKGKSTAKRSPRATPRLTAPTVNSSQAPTSTLQAKSDSSQKEVLESLDCHLQMKLGPTTHSALVNHTTLGKMTQPLDCGLLPGSIFSTSVLSTSILTTVSHVEQAEIASIGAFDGAMGSYSALPGGHSDGVIDWEKLPDPPSIEFGDPPVIEFPGEFECTWGDCI